MREASLKKGATMAPIGDGRLEIARELERVAEMVRSDGWHGNMRRRMSGGCIETMLDLDNADHDRVSITMWEEKKKAR